MSLEKCVKAFLELQAYVTIRALKTPVPPASLCSLGQRELRVLRSTVDGSPRTFLNSSRTILAAVRKLSVADTECNALQYPINEYLISWIDSRH